VNAAARAARRGWDVPGRRRTDSGYGSVGRLLWVIESGAQVVLPTRISEPTSADPDPTLFDLEAVAS
jgi:hypothetical protein